MFNPLEWLLVQFGDGWNLITSLSWDRFVAFFWPVLFLDFPRHILTDFISLVHDWWFTPDLENTEFAKRLRGKNPPLVSVMIVGYNEGATIEKSLRSLLENTYPNKEIIVVNDGSTDDMGVKCEALLQKYKFRYLAHQDREGKSAAANNAIRLTRGEFIMYGDADTSYDRDAIYQALLPFADPQVGAVSANLRIRNPSVSLATRFQAMEYIKSIGVGRRFMALTNILTIVSGAFGVLRKSALDHVGGFDVGPGEDGDMTLRIRKAGYKIAFAPKAIGMTSCPPTWYKFIRQRLRWSRSTVRNRIRKHRDLYRWQTHDLSTTIASLDSGFFKVFLLGSRFFYYGLLIHWHPHLIMNIFFATWIIYMIGALIQWCVAFLLSDRKEQDIMLFPLVPLYSMFTLLHAIIRLYAYVDETLFHTSYRDPHVPQKVGVEVRQFFRT